MSNGKGSHWRTFVEGWQRNHWSDSATEFLVVFLLSNLPFLVLIVIDFLTTLGSDVTFGGAVNVIRHNWKPGEILIFVSALLAPVSYLMTKYHRANRHMTGFTFLSLVLLLMYVGSSIVFALDRLHSIHNEEVSKNIALGLYATAVVIWYLSLVFQRKLEHPPIQPDGNAADRIAAQLGQGD